MIFSAVIFFDSKLHIFLLEKIKMVLNNTLTFFKIKISNTSKTVNKPIIIKKIIPFILVSFLFIQVIFPFRYFLYPGELFWNEQGTVLLAR